MKFNNILDQITSNSDIDKDMIFNIADNVKNADLSDEKVIRNLIRDIGKIANRPVPKELEDNLVDKIKSGGVPKDLSDLF
jgi:Stage VI sporulation protein F